MSTSDSFVSNSDKPATIRNLGWLVRSSGLIVSARFAGVLIGIVTQVLIARALGASDLGLFFVATALSMILATMLAAGYPMMVPKLVAKEFGDPERTEHSATSLRRFMSHARGSIVGVSAILCSLATLAVWFWPALAQADRIILSVAILTALPLAFLRLNGALANALRQFSLGYVPDIFVRPLLLLGLIAALWMIYPGFGLLAVLLGHVLIASALAVWQLNRLSRQNGDKFHNNLENEQGSGQSDNDIKRQWLRQSLNIMPGAVFVMVFGDIALLVSGLFLTSENVGIFGVALRISLLAGFTIHTVHQVTVRDLADAAHQNSSGKLKKTLRRTNLFNTFLGIGGLGFAILFGPIVLGIFGQEFLAGYTCLIILMAAQLIRAVAGPTMQMIALTGLERASLPAFGVGLLVLASASTVLMPTYELVGAALAVLLATATWSIWLAVLVWLKKGINVSLARF